MLKRLLSFLVAAMLMGLATVSAQVTTSSMSGKVTAQDEPIIGANVVVKGSTTGTITDMDGNFTLEVPDQATLLVSYIGYTPKEVAVKNQNNLSIMMIEDSKTIDEVVVIG